MFKGFYTLSSGMLTQQHRLDTVSNNITNVSTPGFKKDTLISTTFREELTSRTGNVDKSNVKALHVTSTIQVPDEVVTDFQQGSFDMTGDPFHFAIAGTGFFQIDTEDGPRYTRNGAFTLDEEGYLCLEPIGRVRGENGDILLKTDEFTVDQTGAITLENGSVAGRIQFVDFQDYNQLIKNGEGVFLNANNANVLPAKANLRWKELERSNVVSMDEITDMMSSQRALQSESQILKIYDQIIQKAVNDIGKI
ncbi:flagellar hook-basal body protein [Sinanaerobacter sp. ZZT-01]|uniref:flagellar hook-basal body protein n=1 Tax=Sinanaerobacter sp. ZZT-01 TaxID=3111540 RepID=UPI002D7986B0|nr:flagellar hook-basal body protein [Sinanaerobacter sp. ZZT-01]WRR93568.1 flagellar hook-basal body protein [Sinanaerobacter sp. ZZT-01]